MVVIDLDNEGDVNMTDKAHGKEVRKNINFKKKLIFEVRKHPVLYDNKHKFFSNVAKKELIWQKIAKNLKSEVDVCKNTWMELRYRYQCYARRLHNFLLNGHKQNRKRPAMNFELELMFLWRFIDNRKSSTLPFDITEIVDNPEEESASQSEIVIIDDDKIENTNKFSNTTKNNKEIDDDLILVEQPVELIVIDEDDENDENEISDNKFKINSNLKKLLEEIKSFPELYDCEHVAFKDYTGKSLIWNGISYKLREKATKLMKCWIILQTRYEWELMHENENTENNTPSELQKELEFLKEHILKNPDTVYKQSYFLKTAWYDPIDYFKEIYNLIVRMKKVPAIVHVTDALLNSREKNKQYLCMWSDIAHSKGSTPGQCETTWLIMRYFYWELMFMRIYKYNLADKWYFEAIITELYAISKAAQEAKQKEQQKANNNKLVKILSSTSVENTKTSSSTTINAVKNTSFINNNQQSLPITISSAVTITSSTVTTPITMPKITSAISLAPKALKGNSGSLLIKQITRPPGVAIQQSITPNTQTINCTIPTAVASSVLATSAQQQIPATPLQMPTNLPSQLKVASVPMPGTAISVVKPLVAPVAGNKTPSTVWPVRTQAISLPFITTSVNAQPSLAHNSTSLIASTSSSSYSRFPTSQPLSTITLNQCTAAISSSPISVPTPITSEAPTTSTNTSSTIPKISAAVSLLNPNEILIELISSQNGNHLVVHGPPLKTKYQLSMPTVAKLIREILGIPLLHNKHHNQPTVVNNYWEKISQLFNLPVHICRACWNFLLENFNHFPQIAPLKELMRPFPTTFNVWMESEALFKKFDEHCTSMGWLQYMDCLPEVVECIGCYPVLYQDVAKGNTEIITSHSEMEALCAWRTISLRFPKIPPLKEIWKSFKNCFCQYMSDLEFSIENKWPLNWWRALARLKFLVEAKYSSNEPFYFIVSNKMVEEIDRCAMLEMKLRYTKNDAKPVDNTVTEILPEPIPIDIDLEPQKDVELGTLLTAMQKHPEIFSKADTVAKYEAWKDVANELHISVIECLMAFKKAIQRYFAYKKQDPLNHCRINEKYYKKLDTIVRNIQSNNASTSQTKLNIKTPSELNQQSLDSTLPHYKDYVFPERFLSDINMTSCPSNLAVKNWIYGFGNIYYSNQFNSTVKVKLNNVLKKYMHNIDIS